MWFLQGEVCCASSRVYVQEGIYDQVEKKLVEKAKAWIVGDPLILKPSKDLR
jgi:coniferyl-aldehyde dehydrogenase